MINLNRRLRPPQFLLYVCFLTENLRNFRILNLEAAHSNKKGQDSNVLSPIFVGSIQILKCDADT